MSRKKLSDSKKMLTSIGERLCYMERALGINGNQLAISIGISASYLSTLKYNKTKQGGKDFWHGIRNNFPEWGAFLRRETDNAPVIFTESKDSSMQTAEGKGLFGTTKFHDGPEGRVVVTEFAPGNKADHQDRDADPLLAAIADLKAIFDSGDPVLIPAIKANLAAFRQAARDKGTRQELAQLLKAHTVLMREVEELKRKGDAGAGVDDTGTDHTG